jgi:hypothetical protein
MFLPIGTGPLSAVDAGDVEVIQPRNAVSCVVWLTDGSFRLADVDAATVAANLNFYGVGGPVTTPPTQLEGMGACYVAGVLLSSLQGYGSPIPTRAAVLTHGGKQLVVTDDPSIFFANVTLCVAPGAAGPPAASSPFVEAQSFTLAINNLGGGTVTQNGPTEYIRVGPPGSTVAAVGDIVRWSTRLFVDQIPFGQSLNVELGAGFPVPNVGTCCVASVRLVAGLASDLADGLLINRANNNAYYVQIGPFSAITTLGIDLCFTQTVGV